MPEFCKRKADDKEKTHDRVCPKKDGVNGGIRTDGYTGPGKCLCKQVPDRAPVLPCRLGREEPNRLGEETNDRNREKQEQSVAIFQSVLEVSRLEKHSPGESQ